MYRAKYGKVVESNTHGDSQEIKIKELNPLMFWKTYNAELNMNYRKLVACYDLVKFLIDDHGNVLAVKSYGQDATVKDLFDERVR